MKKSFTLTVPEPCHEYWNDMTPNEQGRHCAVCTKTVVDFTRKTDREIAKLVKSGDSLCGRFKKEQLGRPITLPRKRDAFFELVPPSYAASLLIPVALFGTQHIEAQETNTTPVEQVSTYQIAQPQIVGRIAVNPTASAMFTLKGTVSDENGPLPGASIYIKGTKRGTQTDYDGKYGIEVTQGDTLIVAFVGYASKEIFIDHQTATPVNSLLAYDYELMGDIIITGMLRVSPKSKLTTENELPKNRRE